MSTGSIFTKKRICGLLVFDILGILAWLVIDTFLREMTVLESIVETAIICFVIDVITIVVWGRSKDDCFEEDG